MSASAGTGKTGIQNSVVVDALRSGAHHEVKNESDGSCDEALSLASFGAGSNISWKLSEALHHDPKWHVLACGYRHVKSASTSLAANNPASFDLATASTRSSLANSNPAWLVYNPQAKYAFWRRRKDLVILATGIPKLKAPKKALEKLSDDIDGLPWHRPDLISWQHDDDDAGEDNLSDSSNQWNQSKYAKPVERIDQYLLDVGSYVEEEILPRKSKMTLKQQKLFKQWKSFIQWTDVPGVIEPLLLSSHLSTRQRSTFAISEPLSNDEAKDVLNALSPVYAGSRWSSVFHRDEPVKYRCTIVVPYCATGEVLWGFLQDDGGNKLVNARKNLILFGCEDDFEKILACKRKDTNKSVHWMKGDFMTLLPPIGCRRRQVLGKAPVLSLATTRGATTDKTPTTLCILGSKLHANGRALLPPPMMVQRCFAVWDASAVVVILDDAESRYECNATREVGHTSSGEYVITLHKSLGIQGQLIIFERTTGLNHNRSD